MPNWKKIILSGSNAILGTLKIPSIVAAGSVTTGTNVVTIDSDGKLHMTSSYGGGGGTSTNPNLTERSILVRGGALGSQGTATNLQGGSSENNKFLKFIYADEGGPAGSTSTWTLASVGSVTSVGTTGTVNGITLTGTVTSAGSLTLGGTLAISNSDWSGTDLSVANGGTGVSTITANHVPFGNGTSAIQTSTGFQYNGTNKILNLVGTDSSGNSPLNLDNVQTNTEDTNALVLVSNGNVEKRALGANAFTNTSIPTNPVLLTGNQTIGGTKTFSTSATFSGGSTNSGQVLLMNGSVSTPSIAFSSDGDLGFFKNASAATIEVTIGNSLKTSLETNGIQTVGLGVGTAPGTTTGLIRATNDVVAFYSSDKRLKNNIETIKSPLEKLSKINGVEFDWIPKEGIHENEGHDVGVIAQEVEKVIPEIVQTRDNGYKAVKYEKIVPLLVEAIKELQAEIQELKNNK